MQPIKQAKRALLSPQILFTNLNSFLFFARRNINKINGNNSRRLPLLCYCYCYCYYSTVSAIPVPQINFRPNITCKSVVQSFKEWFRSPNYGIMDRIFEILSKQDEVDEVALSQLGLRLTESLVLDVLDHGRSQNDVLSCLKFFDWAGRQYGFRHTRATFLAIFKILSKAKLVPLMLDFLDNFNKLRYANQMGYGFHTTLILGYSVAGKPLVALQLFGRMRFQGVDLDGFTYNVLLNSLVEECCFDAVDAIARQISNRGFENHTTHSIVVKSFCKQEMLDEAEAYLRRMVLRGETGNGDAVGMLVNTLCRKGQVDKARKLAEEFRKLGVVPMEPVYGMWLQNLVQSNKLDGALEFIQHRKSVCGYVPDVFRYNELLQRLLKGSRLTEACDLLMEMMESGISPDKVTMNAALCFFCKAGMVNVALDLYNSRSEFGLSPTAIACNYLINSLCGEGRVNEAYRVLKSAIEQGHFPGKRTFSILGDALCREGKLDMMKELVFDTLDHNFVPSGSVYDKFISALCRASRLEDGYLVYGELNRMNQVPKMSTFSNLIHGFNRFNKGDVAARLLIEMQDKGYVVPRSLFRAVIQSLCDMENPESQFYNFLEMQLSRHRPTCMIFNFFIDGAGHAKKPDTAREVFEMMQNIGIKPNLNSDILMLQSYLKSERISEAFDFFNSLHQRRKVGRKLYNTMVVGLCKVNKLDCALSFFEEMQGNGVFPSVECYEVIILLLCSNRRYNMAIDLIRDFEKTRRPITSFIGNTLLFHSLQSDELYNAWCEAREVQNEVLPNFSLLGQIIGAFSGGLRLNQEIENLEEVIGQCFPLDLFTYNMFLRRLSMNSINHAFKLFNQICQKGYEPNRWTYDILVHGLYKHGMPYEARRWMDEMFRNGFYPTSSTKQLM